MVKGITRQVVVVQGGDPAMFEQAIFLVRDDLVSQGGVSEEALLEEARRACSPRLTLWARIRDRLLYRHPDKIQIEQRERTAMKICGAPSFLILWSAARSRLGPSG